MAERVSLLRQAMRREQFDLLIAASPMNVRLLSGYWPVTGKSLALLGTEREWLIVPEDEARLARNGWVGEVRTFAAGSLDHLRRLRESLAIEMGKIAQEVSHASEIGIEHHEVSVPSPYVGTVHHRDLNRLVLQVFPGALVRSADQLFEQQRSVLVERELSALKEAISYARHGFERCEELLKPGERESQAAARLTNFLHDGATELHRAGGQFFCMSGANSARAYAAYQQSTDRRLGEGDIVLVHCNSYLDGLWTDITRTFCLGPTNKRFADLTKTLLQSRDAALGAIRPAALGRDVDACARKVLEKARLGKMFKHGTGHGVGFAAIDHLARPRIHPASDDVLEEGMVFNIEPAVYFENEFGLRHCDMVRVTQTGVELLTPFQGALEGLTVG